MEEFFDCQGDGGAGKRFPVEVIYGSQVKLEWGKEL